MNRWFYGFLLILSCLSVPVLATEGKAASFFEALYDVPVMPGLKELPDQAMLFDKPDGRIASVVAASSHLGVEEVRRFYLDTLPQLGWRKTSENQYVRGGDRLTMELSKKPPLTIVHFTLEPNKP